MLVSGRIFQFLLVIVIYAIHLFYDYNKEKYNIDIRTLPAIEALPEAVGRATEMGRPVFSNIGGGVGGREARPERVASTLAGYVILGHVAELCAEKGTDLIVSVGAATALPVAKETLRTAYLKSGAAEKEIDVRFMGGSQFSNAAGSMGIMRREGAASVVLMGTYGAEALILSEAANVAGAMVIAGTEITYQVAVFAATCDYAIFGEEMFAASASISKSSTELSSLRSKDIIKFILSGLMLIGFLLALVGNNLIVNLLGW